MPWASRDWWSEERRARSPSCPEGAVHALFRLYANMLIPTRIGLRTSVGTFVSCGTRLPRRESVYGRASNCLYSDTIHIRVCICSRIVNLKHTGNARGLQSCLRRIRILIFLPNLGPMHPTWARCTRSHFGTSSGDGRPAECSVR